MTSKTIFQKIFAYALLSFLITGCKKDKDTVYPSIEILEPNNNATYNAADTIVVKATFKDDKKLEYVSVKLQNEQNVNIGSIKTFYPENNSYTLQTTYILGDILTPTGKYTFDFVAYDGTNIKHEFIDIYLNEVPKKREKVLLFAGNSSTEIYDFNQGNPQLLQQFSGSPINAYINSKTQQVWLLHNHSEIKLLDASGLSPQWSTNENCSQSFPCITASGFFNDEMYYATYYQKIKSLDNNGTPKFTYTLTNTNEFSDCIFADNDYVFAEIKNYQNSLLKLNVHYELTAAFKQSFDYTYGYSDIIGIAPYGPNEYLVLLNDNSGNAALLVYNIISNSNWTPKTLPTQNATSFTVINDNEILMTIGSTTYLYLISNNSLLPYFNQAYSKIFYEPLNNELYAIVNNQTDVYDYSSKQLKFSYTHCTPINKIAFLYNK